MWIKKRRQVPLRIEVAFRIDVFVDSVGGKDMGKTLASRRETSGGARKKGVPCPKSSRIP